MYGRSRWLCLSLAWAEVQELAFVVWEPRPRLGCDGDKFSGFPKAPMPASQFVERLYGQLPVLLRTEDQLRGVSSVPMLECRNANAL